MKILLLLGLSSMCFCASFSTNAQRHLVRVQHSAIHWSIPPNIQQIEGNGICISHNCSIVATAYHIQMLVGRPNLEIDGSRTEKVLSLGNQADSGKTSIPIAVSGVGKKTLTYNPARDILFIYAKRPVAHKSGMSYSYKSGIGQTVQVAGYYKNRLQIVPAHIIGVDIPLTLGEARVNENLVLDIGMRPGMSGSAVLDEQGNLLGMITLTGAIKGNGRDVTASVALPTKTLARALMELDPSAGTTNFDGVAGNTSTEVLAATTTGISGVLYEDSDWAEEDATGDASSLIPQLTTIATDVPNPVERLRTKSAAASKLMVNLITRQCLERGAAGQLCHELSVIEGEQTFREIASDGNLGKPSQSFPRQNHGIWIQSDWADTLIEIAENPWNFQGAVDGRYLFTFSSTAEAERCYWEEYSTKVPLFGGGHAEWKGAVDCIEWVVTDADFNVLNVFTEMYPPAACFTRLVQTAIFYDWIKLEDMKAPILLPVAERVTGRVLGQRKLLSANVTWTGYKAFRAEHQMKF